MTESNGSLRVCPTRADGRAVLVAHKVSLALCQDRQRCQYHKCFACAFNNAYVAKHGLPRTASPDEPEADRAIELPAAPVIEDGPSSEEESPTEAPATQAKVAS